MGMNNMGAVLNSVVFDAETAPLPDASDFIEPVAAPANYKDPEKIAAYVKERSDEQINRAGLDVDLCRVVSLAWDGPLSNYGVARNEAEEAYLIGLFWSMYQAVRGPILCGFNILSFDLLVLLRRSQYLGIEAPHIALDRYRTPHIDLMQKLTWNGAVRARSQKFYLRRFGIPCDDTVSGADVAGLIEKGDYNSVLAHNRADVVGARLLGERLGFLPKPAMVEAPGF